MLARGNRHKAWAYWLEALESDIADVQGGTTGEGIHHSTMAGTVGLLQRGFTGLETRRDVLDLDPYLPDSLTGLPVWLRYRGHRENEVTSTHDSVTVGCSARRPPSSRYGSATRGTGSTPQLLQRCPRPRPR